MLQLLTQYSQTDGARFNAPLDTKKHHFGDVLPSQSLGSVLKKPNPTKLQPVARKSCQYAALLHAVRKSTGLD